MLAVISAGRTPRVSGKALSTRSRLAAAAFAFLAAVPGPAGAAEDATILVLDASGSMWGQLADGRTKIEVAREVLDGFLDGRDPAAPLGVIAYGHRRKGDCGDIEVLASTGPQDAATLSARLKHLNPTGKTPLGQSLRTAAGEIPKTAESADIVLVTDGLETCDVDPCAVAAELAASGIRIRAHVVGFGLTEQETQALACVPDRTGGLLLRPQTGAELADALARTTAAAEPPPPPAEPAEPSMIDAPLSWPARSRFVAAWSVAEGTAPAAAGKLDRFVWAPANDPDTRGVFTAEVAPAPQGNVEIQTPETAGEWILRLDRWSEGASDFQTLASVPVTVEAEAYSLRAAATAEAGAALPVDWAGPAGEGDWIGLWPADTDRTSAALSASDVLTGIGGGVTLGVPVEPGAYEVRFVAEGLEGRTIHARAPLTVTEPRIAVSAPVSVPPATSFAFLYRGPAGGDGWIDFTKPGETTVWGGGYAFGGYATLADGIPEGSEGFRRLEIVSPDEPGRYALRVVISTNDRRAVHWTDVEVSAGAVLDPIAVPGSDAAPAPDTVRHAAAPEGDFDPTHGPDAAVPDEDVAHVCKGPAPCRVEDPATGLSFMLPAGWFTDHPTLEGWTAGSAEGLPRVTFYDRMEVPNTIVLNPRQWVAMNGPCESLGPVGDLCLFESGEPAVLAAYALVKATLTFEAPEVKSGGAPDITAGVRKAFETENPALRSAVDALMDAAKGAEPGAAPDPAAILRAVTGIAGAGN